MESLIILDYIGIHSINSGMYGRDFDSDYKEMCNCDTNVFEIYIF